MPFHEIQFPTDMCIGSRGGPGFSTYITELDSGTEQRVSRWSTPRYQYDIAYTVKRFTQLAALRKFYNARMGCTYGFRYKDFVDFCSTADGLLLSDGLGAAIVTNVDQSLGTGDGSTTQFQLTKTYSDGVGTVPRIISKPVHTNGGGHGNGTVVIAIGAVSQTTGWTVNSTSGIVTFTSAPSIGAVITAGFQFDVPVRFDKAIDQELSCSIDDWNSGAVASVPLIEIVNPVASPGEAFLGGSDTKSFAASISLSAGDARVQSLTPTGAGLAVTLPPLVDMPFGGPAFELVNDSASNTLAIKKQETGATLDTMPAGPSRIWELIIKKDSGGNKVWDFHK